MLIVVDWIIPQGGAACLVGGVAPFNSALHKVTGVRMLESKAIEQMSNSNRVMSIAVVDTKPLDYVGAKPLCNELNVIFLPDGHTGLRLARLGIVDIWVVNVRLSDMSGFDLLEMIVSLHSRTTIIAVAEQYRAEDERKALLYGACYFTCKPLDFPWLVEKFATPGLCID